MSSFKPCFVIPNYNHHLVFSAVVDQLSQYNIPIIIVNDGSNKKTRDLLISIADKLEQVELINLDENQGKGGAVMAGLLYASESGYSHAFQVDADGQHSLSDISKFFEFSEKYPDKIICGAPVYDKSVPLGRLISRYITHFWVWIETLSFQIKDSMCGFRIYPLKYSVEVIKNNRLGKGMDFDPEILVRSYWQGHKLLFLPTKVIYPEDGVSNFRLIEDNWLITKMHTKLFFGMLLRIPSLIKRNWVRKSDVTIDVNWGKETEVGSLLGLRFMVFCYKVFGFRVFQLVLHPVIAFFTLMSKAPYLASKQYLNQLAVYNNKTESIGWRQVYKHFYEFGLVAIDKIRSWMGEFPESEVIIHCDDLFNELIDSKKGAIFIASHLGNIELCRALGNKRHNMLKLNALAYTENALKYKKVISDYAPDAHMDMVDVTNFGIDTTLLLQQKVEKGEVIIVVGDRVSVTAHSRVYMVDFLGKQAPFGEGPFTLASILDCPVYFLFCHKEEGIYNIYLEKVAESFKYQRAVRKQKLADKVQLFADRLTYYCNKAPYQWFNFYNYWKIEDTANNNNE